ncbi:ATP-binding protein [Litoribacter alkaliphilus]|uniref:ATP-binding protein n=1 Tax=Litoribacter ruber TaxID=702568 RepID=A0AAP2CM00_9BACT|nr:ATP-binding protein [Litoribacter alkaliphilus]MBS9524337.1 ATP-binding protein [Litoribacter alkaliphilus]
MLRIVIIGPESTGKSTLAKGLSDHFGEPWVREYAREYLEQLDREYRYEDLLPIAQGQIQLEELAAKNAEKMLFCDTDLHVIDVWSRHKYGKTHAWTLDEISRRNYDLYLLTNIDMPWEPDPQREHPEPEMRNYFFNVYLEKIQTTSVPYQLVSGMIEERLHASIEIIEALMRKKRMD